MKKLLGFQSFTYKFYSYDLVPPCNVSKSRRMWYEVSSYSKYVVIREKIQEYIYIL